MHKSPILDRIHEIEVERPELEDSKLFYFMNLLLALLAMFTGAMTVQFGYNKLIPNITNLPAITFAQALLLDCLVSFIVKIKIDRDDLIVESLVYKAVKSFLVIVYNMMALGLMFLISLGI